MLPQTPNKMKTIPISIPIPLSSTTKPITPSDCIFFSLTDNVLDNGITFDAESKEAQRQYAITTKDNFSPKARREKADMNLDFNNSLPDYEEFFSLLPTTELFLDLCCSSMSYSIRMSRPQCLGSYK